MGTIEGIIIKTVPLREADLIIHTITREAGRQALLAKHARRSKRRFSGGLDLFDHGLFSVSSSRGSLHIVDSFNAKESFKALREDITKLSCATVLCECFDRLIKESVIEGSAELFDTLNLGLNAINESGMTRDSLRALYLSIANLLDLCGYFNQEQAGLPSSKNLYSLLEQLEMYAEQEVKSKSSLLPLIKSLR